MMTHHAKFNTHSGRGRMTHVMPVAILKLLAATIIATLFTTNDGAAQRVIYSQPVSSSYPSSHHPADANSSPYPETIISERVIHSSAASRNPTLADSSNPIVKRDSTNVTTSKPNPQRELATRLASTSTYRSPSHLSANGSYDSRPSTYEYTSPYRLAMIESARRSAAQFRLIAESAPDIAAKMAIENAQLAEQWAEVAETYHSLFARLVDASEKLGTTMRGYEDVNSKITDYGLTPTIGLLLRHKKEQLDAWQVQDSQTVITSQEMKRLRGQQLEFEMVRYDGTDAFGETAEILAEAGYDTTNPKHATLASQVQRLLGERKQWLDSLGRVYQDYQQKLSELDATTAASAKLARDYRALINRHIIWIRSGDPVSAGDLRNLRGGIAALFDPGRSEDFGPTIERKLEANPAGGFGLLFWIALILIARWRTKSWLIGIGGRKRMRDATDSARKVTTGILTTLVAFGLPAILYLAARWLSTGVVSESTLYASSGFYAASLVALMVEVPRQLLRNLGYVDKHVNVELPRRERAIKYLTLFGLAWVVAAYGVTVMGLVDHGMWRGSISRFGFMVAMLLVAIMSHLSLRPNGGYLEPFIAKFGGRVIHRIRLVIYMAGIGFPLAMIALSALGYGFTANELIKRAIITLVSLQIGATLWAGLKILAASVWQMLTGSAPAPRQHDEYGAIEIRVGYSHRNAG